MSIKYPSIFFIEKKESKMVRKKRAFLFIGIAVFTFACSGLACFFYLTSGQSYFLVIALIVFIVGISNIMSKIMNRLSGMHACRAAATPRESAEQYKYEKTNNRKG